MLILEREHFEACLDYLTQYHPRSLPIYYLLYGVVKKDHAWDGSEFVLDQWPCPQAIVYRPKATQPAEDAETRDTSVRQILYTVTVWSCDASKLERLLSVPDMLPWKMEIIFHGVSCPDDRIVVENVCEQEGSLDITDGSSCEIDCCDVMELRPETLVPCSLELPEGYVMGSLRPSHARQINREWAFGGNEQTRLYLEAVLDPENYDYPSAAVLDPAGNAISYIMYEPEGNMAMGYTAPAHRGKGFFRMVNYVLTKTLFDLGRPNTYVQISPKNMASRMTYLGLGATLVPGWRQHWILYRGRKDSINRHFTPVTYNCDRADFCK